MAISRTVSSTLAGRSGYERRSRRSRSAGRTAEGGTARSGFDARPTASQRPRTARSSPARASSVTVAGAARPVALGGWPEQDATRLRFAWRFSFHRGAARPAQSVGGLRQGALRLRSPWRFSFHSLHRPQRLLADLAPELGAQRDELGRFHRARVVQGEVQHRLDPSGARRHDGDPRREEERLVQAVGHEDHGLARPAPDVEEPLAHEHARLLVEGAERLVHQEDLRVDGERAADRDALLHAPGELAGVLLREALEAERREELRRDRASARRRRAPELEAELHVLEHRAPGKEARILEHGRDPTRVGAGDRPGIDQDAPAVRLNETAEHAEERGFAAARRTDQRAELALAHRERHVVERLDRPRAGRVALGDPLDRDEPVGRGHESWRISRAMTSRWISDVPSPISVSLASRKIRSTGNSVM